MACFRIALERPDGTTGVYHDGSGAEWYNAPAAHTAFVLAVGTGSPGLVVALLADGKPVARCRVEQRDGAR